MKLKSRNGAMYSNVFSCADASPSGAGLCVRVNVATAYRKLLKESSIRISGQTGDSLTGGEDIEISYVTCHIGLGMAVFLQLANTHLIPKERVTEGYLVKIHEGIMISHWLLAYKWQGITPRNPLSPWRILSFLKNILLYHGTQRRIYCADRRAILKALRIIHAAKRESGF